MRLNDFYSRKWNIARLILAVAVPPLTQLPSLFISEDNTLLALLIIMLISALLYVLPFVATLSLIRLSKADACKRCIALDAIFLLCPVLLSSVAMDVIDSIINGVTVMSGSYVVIFGILYILITVCFWGLYLLAAHMNKAK